MESKKMNKNPTLTTLPAEDAHPAAATGANSPKRGFKPRWLRLQRRERKLKEARALALRTVG
jgi:hypothetical protein